MKHKILLMPSLIHLFVLFLLTLSASCSPSFGANSYRIEIERRSHLERLHRRLVAASHANAATAKVPLAAQMLGHKTSPLLDSHIGNSLIVAKPPAQSKPAAQEKPLAHPEKKHYGDDWALVPYHPPGASKSPANPPTPPTSSHPSPPRPEIPSTSHEIAPQTGDDSDYLKYCALTPGQKKDLDGGKFSRCKTRMKAFFGNKAAKGKVDKWDMIDDTERMKNAGSSENANREYQEQAAKMAPIDAAHTSRLDVEAKERASKTFKMDKTVAYASTLTGAAANAVKLRRRELIDRDVEDYLLFGRDLEFEEKMLLLAVRNIDIDDVDISLTERDIILDFEDELLWLG